MTFSKNRLLSFLFALVFAITLVGCGQEETAETEGQKLDEAAAQGKGMMEETEEKTKETGQ